MIIDRPESIDIWHWHWINNTNQLLPLGLLKGQWCKRLRRTCCSCSSCCWWRLCSCWASSSCCGLSVRLLSRCLCCCGRGGCSCGICSSRGCGSGWAFQIIWSNLICLNWWKTQLSNFIYNGSWNFVIGWNGTSSDVVDSIPFVL